MLHGIFELNNNSKSKNLLFFPGVGGFEAYSGNKQYRNQNIEIKLGVRMLKILVRFQ